ncbi:YhcN/YlaJ family sporulation lipoprotein [Bacillus haynesii]|uniref:YhcN/YlaJ family sporulation lipoprotein n=1 Tax=Bacillus haynesii TaxID=1925021 RepID=UPI002281CD36|nr:YhcN/YlaJ family sporulation lipoprotein [Bacillus haynesii]MCY8241241.1 YhcN/YlaJ family sporulation lipoprotein [Bacillus haynesii]
MNYFLITVFLLFITTITNGCQNATENNNQNKQMAVRHVNVQNEKADQTVANKAKDKLLKREEVTEVRGANSDQDLVLAVQVEQFDRFRLKDIEKQSKEMLKKDFPGYSIEVSTDQKIFWELDKLEKQLENKKSSEKKLKKELTKIKKLMKEKP